ncbi:unnamed protein product [Heligmosomoides polygyrus]|uniref:SH3 domain-containing protein n=1 Tax=Heligmosomoides polygyrus TaxID=6339 RepID=A0A183GIB5_HELPZ|nr:unnamed protein product [Heligmosomoides polygyrus]
MRIWVHAREGTLGWVPSKLLVWKLLSSLRGSPQLDFALFERRIRLGKGLQDGFCAVRAQNQAKERTPGWVPSKMLEWKVLSSLKGTPQLDSALFERRIRLGKGLQDTQLKCKNVATHGNRTPDTPRMKETLYLLHHDPLACGGVTRTRHRPINRQRGL